ncbi:hypothetical protein M422DRAFT_53342 [Sphaerobolus stellatus SS14]|uniref:Uncharacterized protein n=1 Tax=Sphaerobolus stellatus (strain SS14) TaxID=990650 RepID=A0A0C9V1S4_SPHS4|nr:hypothetical protein M422DRAFT_53342 [Sphaerobolus stellatus SS14]
MSDISRFIQQACQSSPPPPERSVPNGDPFPSENNSSTLDRDTSPSPSPFRPQPPSTMTSTPNPLNSMAIDPRLGEGPPPQTPVQTLGRSQEGLTASQSRKRGGIEEHVDKVIREIGTKRLKTASQEKFRMIARKSTPEREAFCIGALISLLDGPGISGEITAAQWEAPKALKTGMAKHSLLILLSPSLGVYLGDELTNILMATVRRNLKTWGLSENFEKAHQDRWEIIWKLAQEVLTQKRSDIKSVIQKHCASQDKDRNTLQAQSITKLCKALCGLVKVGLLTSTLAMAARWAFIRQIYILEKGDKKLDFWPNVNAGLAEARKQAQNDPIKLNKIFGRCLEQDQKENGDDAGGISFTMEGNTEQQEYEKLLTASPTTGDSV